MTLWNKLAPVSATTNFFLLTEAGFHLLQENVGKIIIGEEDTPNPWTKVSTTAGAAWNKLA